MKLPSSQLAGLLELSKSENLLNGSYYLFLEETVINLSEKLDVPRVGFWLYDEKRQLIVNEISFDGHSKPSKSMEVLERKDYPDYFDAFQNSLVINARNAQTDPRTSEFTESYLIPHNIKSMLDAQVSVHGHLLGILCLEQTHITNWKETEELYLAAASALIGQAYISKLKHEEELKRMISETNYRNLFYDSPIPMWVYDHLTFKFMAVNNCAVRNYGYSKEEFLQMSIMDIRPENQQEKLINHIKEVGHLKWISSTWQHQFKNGKIIDVDISSDWTVYNGKKSRIVIALDKTDEKKLFEEKELYISKLKDFAFYASHNLRGPVARLLGLNSLLEFDCENTEIMEDILKRMHSTVHEIDAVINTLNSKLDVY